MTRRTEDLRIAAIEEVISPEQLHAELPLSETAAERVLAARQAAHEILSGADDRLVVVTGPCSIHDPDAALDYAQRLAEVRGSHGDDLLVLMRVYFEKPRTTVGWKGLINDPDLDGSFHINKGLRLARRLLLAINEAGVPAATEFLDLITPQYLADLISWGAIGARTTESQLHREMASGLSCPVGFKNATDGSVKVAVDAVRAAAHPHHFLSMTQAGRSAIFSTQGNEDCHIILRGGRTTNYDAGSVEQAAGTLTTAGLAARLMIDFSHANSRKQFQRQIEVGRDVAAQIAGGDRRIVGVMIESHLNPGRQDLLPGRAPDYGVSITDACLGWDDTAGLLDELALAVRARRQARRRAAVS
jgi:3-deoxy-7-phosphoheptulonate synthase